MGLRRYRVRFYRLKERPEDKASWFEHDVLSWNWKELQVKVDRIADHFCSGGGLLYKVKVLGYSEA